MSTNEQIELRLVREYDQEIDDFFLETYRDSTRGGKDSSKQFIQKMQFKIDIFEKQVLNYKELFPENHNIQQYEARIYFFQGFMRQISGVHYDIYGGMFSPSLKGELKAALNLYDKSLQLNEHSKTRTMKVFCYRQLKDINSALRELNFIIKHYADDEEVYLAARKEKDELETRFKL